MNNIIGISGKKQSGKTTAGNFLFGCAMLSNKIVDYAEIDEKGQLIVPYHDNEGKSKPCVFPVDSVHPTMVSYMQESVWDSLKIYNFADNLKRVCVDILGLDERQCYGTEQDKNSRTNIRNPDIPTDAKIPTITMTAREVMQCVGTDFFRKIYPNVWVDSTIRKIKKDSPELAVIVDCRFPNEVKGIQSAGGKVIRLARNIFGNEDQHPSETALDEYDGFDAIIDNQNMSVGEQNEALYNQLAEWGSVKFKAVAGMHKPA